MADTPKRGGPTLVGTAAVAIYTAPTGAGTYGILRSINLANETAALIHATVGIFTSAADAAGRRLFNSTPVAPNDSVQWTGFLPLIGGTTPDLIYALSDTASGLTIVCGIIEGA